MANLALKLYRNLTCHFCGTLQWRSRRGLSYGRKYLRAEAPDNFFGPRLINRSGSATALCNLLTHNLPQENYKEWGKGGGRGTVCSNFQLPVHATPSSHLLSTFFLFLPVPPTLGVPAPFTTKFLPPVTPSPGDYITAQMESQNSLILT